jgi:hypothetical protein
MHMLIARRVQCYCTCSNRLGHNSDGDDGYTSIVSGVSVAAFRIIATMEEMADEYMFQAISRSRGNLQASGGRDLEVFPSSA